MAKPLPHRPRRDLTIIGPAPASLETLHEIGRVVPADFHGTIFVVGDAGKGGLSRGTTAGRHREKARPDAAAYAGSGPHPMKNKERSRKRA
jgi:hypothetical protein